MIRICPNCKAKLGSFDNYFCSECGNALPQELVLVNVRFKQTIEIEQEPGKTDILLKSFKESLTKVFTVANMGETLLAITLLAAVGYPTYTLMQRMINTLNTSPVIVPVSKVEQSTSSSLAIKSTYKVGSFNPTFANYVPYDADTYVEIADFRGFAEDYALYDKAYAQLVADLEKSISPSFGAFLKNGAWTCILLPNDRDFDVSVINLSNYPWLKAKVVTNALVITTDETVLKDVEDSKGGITKNLSLNSKFVTGRSKLSSQGKIMIVNLTSKGMAQLESLRDKNIPVNFKTLLNTFINSKVDSTVVL
jgi:hypothetical protein